ncbi:MAG: endonuclease/exonuclease/phosphatase family protein [Candidatus Nanopelagicales bacterium]
MQRSESPTNGRGLLIVGRWLAALAIAGSALVIGARALRISWGPLAYLVPLTPYLTVILGLAIVLTIVSRFWAGTLVATAALVIIAIWWIPPFANDPAVTGPPELTVGTSNLKFGLGDACQIVALARDRNIELMSLVEVTDEAVANLQRCGMDRVLPYYFAEPGRMASGSTMWSRYPLTDTSLVPGTQFASLSARVVLPSGPVTWVTAHPIAPGPFNHEQWEKDNAAALAYLTRLSGPVIVSGDFNATRDQPLVLELEDAGFIDAATAAGAGLTRTFPVGESLTVPFVGIDHIMTRNLDLRAVSATTHTISRSDHRALVVDFDR